MKPAEARTAGLYPGLSSAAVMGAVGLLGVMLHQPWLFPSLGPTIFLQTVTPDEPSATPTNTVVGHAIGAAVGFAWLFLLPAQADPSPMEGGVLTLLRLAATASAVGITIILQAAVRKLHPPAAATTMLITLGGLKPTWPTVLALVAGVLLTTALGELARRLHSRRGAY